MKKDFSVSDRIKAPTPKFFRVLRTVGIVIGAVGGAVVAAPVSLPAIVTTIAGYLVTVGTVRRSLVKRLLICRELAFRSNFFCKMSLRTWDYNLLLRSI